eukprot:TRINITY_DN6862_c2_g1_i1.p1 TRINITY_DN6862_c2_g1~~TRINITY_DN6862_c2_g1_i1.p1  ORF type:complete len:187 (+),score=21.49 TRINITY_DN6862_c2_g1_i1:56-616(+)
MNLSTANECEAERCMALAEGFVRKRQFERAARFCKKVGTLSPGTRVAVCAERLLESVEREIESGRAPRVTETQQSTSSPPPPPPVPLLTRAQDYIGTFGILPAYRLPILLIYSLIFLTLLYKFVLFPSAPRSSSSSSSSSSSPRYASTGVPGDLSFNYGNVFFFAPIGSSMLLSLLIGVLQKLLTG